MNIFKKALGVIFFLIILIFIGLFSLDYIERKEWERDYKVDDSHLSYEERRQLWKDRLNRPVLSEEIKLYPRFIYDYILGTKVSIESDGKYESKFDRPPLIIRKGTKMGDWVVGKTLFTRIVVDDVSYTEWQRKKSLFIAHDASVLITIYHDTYHTQGSCHHFGEPAKFSAIFFHERKIFSGRMGYFPERPKDWCVAKRTLIRGYKSYEDYFKGKLNQLRRIFNHARD